MPSLKTIDNGKTFDWGRTSSDYAKYRDIYPDEFYKRIIDLGLCTKGQKVLDLGTGTGVLPRCWSIILEHGRNRSMGKGAYGISKNGAGML